MVASAHFQSDTVATERRFLRRRVRLDVLGVDGAGATFEAVVHDLSPTGMLIETSAPITIGDEIQIDAPRTGRFNAAVIWSQGRYFGCELAAVVSRSGMSAALLKSSLGLESRRHLPREREAASETLTRLPFVKRALAIAALALVCWAPLAIAGRTLFG